MKIEKIEGNRLIYVQYDLKETQEIDLSDLVLSDQLTYGSSLPYSLRTMWDQVPDFKLVLLTNGLAQLRDKQSAPEAYRAAQEEAQQLGMGVWAKPTPSTQPESVQTETPQAPPVSPTPEGTSLIGNFFSFIAGLLKFVWRWVKILSPLGLGGLLLTGAYYFFFIKRRVRLLIIGQKSAGKTAIYWRLVDPTIDREKILALEPTKARQKVKFRRHIQYAKYEIYPRLTDVPGSAYSTVWDELTRYRWLRQHALLVVLSPTEMNSDGSTIPDSKYLDTQLGYVQAFIEGSLGAKKTRKPKVLILFLNKFDLISAHPPGDSAAREKRQQFLTIFGDHISSVELASGKAKIPYRLVIGSAVNNWNCSELISVVGKSLYGS